MKTWAKWFRPGKWHDLPLAILAQAGRVGPLNIQIVSDVGNVRSNNEDSAAAVYPENGSMRVDRGMMLVLADGMGGHNSGEVASRMAVERISKLFFGGRGEVLDRLKNAFHLVNTEIYRAGQEEPHKGMGTTCTAVVTIGDALYVAHVGDSRAYHWREGQLTRMTADQTYVQYLIQTGTLAHEEANKHPKRNVLMQALGAAATVEPEVSCKEGGAAPGDIIFLCSDGLYEYLSDDEIKTYLNEGADRADTAREMVDEAKRRGGHDNITVVLGRIQPLEQDTALKNTQEFLENSKPNP